MLRRSSQPVLVHSGLGSISTSSLPHSSPPLSPKELSPRDNNETDGISPSERLTNEDLKRILETGTKEARLELAAELMKDFFAQVTTKEEAKLALVTVKSVTVSLSKMQSRVKRAKRKRTKGSQSLKTSSGSGSASLHSSLLKEKSTTTTTTSGATSAGTSPPTGSPPSDSVLDEDNPSGFMKKPSLMDLLEFLRTTSEDSEEGVASSVTGTREKIGLGANSLATVGGKNSSLIDLFEFRETAATTTSSSSSSAQTGAAVASTKPSLNPETNNSSPSSPSSTSTPSSALASSTGVIHLSKLKTSNMKVHENAVDLFTFLSGDDEEEDEEDEETEEIQKLLKTHRPTMGALQLDVIILEVADLKIKESNEVYVTLQQNNETFETSTADGSSLTFGDDTTFTVSDPSSPLVVRVYNERDICLGEVILDVNTLEDGEVHDEWFTLQSKNVKSGRIHLRLNYKLENGLLAGIGISSATIPLRVKTGDILLFDKRTNILSYGTKLITRSRWDHVAMVIVLCNTTMMLEATSTEGVQLYPLDEKLEAYRQISNVGLRRLHGAPTKEMLRLLMDFIYEVKGRPYEKNLIQLLKAVYANREGGSGGKPNESDLSALFCSELVAAAYQRMGLLSSTVQTNSFSPKDFASDKFVFSTNEAYLGRVVVFKRRKPNKT